MGNYYTMKLNSTSVLFSAFMLFAVFGTISLAARNVGGGAWNYGTRANVEAGMHACPVGTAISQVGGQPGNFNDFYCVKVTTTNSKVKTVTSRATRQFSNSHTCPKGYYLRGMNIAENRFLCSTHEGANVSTADADIQVTSKGTMACSVGQALVGFNENERKVLCLSVDGL